MHVLGDWGTSRLRLWRLAGGTVVETREGPGTADLAGRSAEACAETLTALVAPWREKRERLQVLLAGMAGSRNGLFEVPYAPLPTDRESWARAARSRDIGHLRVTIAAGVARDGGRPDVMRGEETQLFGALEIEPALTRGTYLVALPGTHCKWVEVDDGCFRRFRTALTGELYALLTECSTLLRTGAAESADAGGMDAGAGGTGADAGGVGADTGGVGADGGAGAAAARIARHGDREAGFAAGAARAAEPDGGLLASLFEARAAQLLHGRSNAWAAGFVSGLLIGREIRELSRSFDPSGGIILVGEPSLSSLYARACELCAIRTRALDGSRCTIAGLMRLRAEMEGP